MQNVFIAKNILHITHTDLDGVGCEILSRALVYNKHNTFTFINTQPGRNLIEAINQIDFNTYDLIIITDLNITKEAKDLIMKMRSKYGDCFVVIDHHEVDYDTSPYSDWLRISYSLDKHPIDNRLDNNDGMVKTSATMLYYLYIRNEALKIITNTIQVPYSILDSAGLCTFLKEHTTEFFPGQGYYAKVLARTKEFANAVDVWDTFNWKILVKEHGKNPHDISGMRLNTLKNFYNKDDFLKYCIYYIKATETHDHDTVKYSSDNTIDKYFPIGITREEIEINVIVNALLQQQERRIEMLKKRVTYTKIAGSDLGYTDTRSGNMYLVGIVALDDLQSMVADRILSEQITMPQYENEYCDLVMVLGMNAPITLSFYSKTMDCSEIARAHGGGGHFGAAGTSIPPKNSHDMKIGMVKRVLAKSRGY